MPIMKPEIQQLLRQAGLSKAPLEADSSLNDKLESAGLGLSKLLEELGAVIGGTGNESLKVSALRDALKLHGVMKETQPQMPSFTIVIQEGAKVAGSAESQSENIFLPRQLLATGPLAPADPLGPSLENQKDTSN